MGMRLGPAFTATAIAVTMSFNALGAHAIPDGVTSSVPQVSVSASSATMNVAVRSDSDLTKINGVTANRAVSAVKGAIDRGEVSIHASTASLRFNQANVYSMVTAEGQTFTTVTTPLDGHRVMSNVTVVLDGSNKMRQYSELHLDEAASGNFKVASYVNGKLVKSGDTGIRAVSDAQLKKELVAVAKKSEGVTGIQMAAKKKNTGACLAAVLGVSGVVGGVIAYVCAGSCAAAAAGVGVPFCVACVAGYATIGGASITAVASCF